MVLLRRVIGDALRARRQAQHRTLREVSTAANVSLGYLSEIERGQKEASSELLASICDALGAQLSEVMREVSDTMELAEQMEGVFAAVPEARPSAVPAMRPSGAAKAKPSAVAGQRPHAAAGARPGAALPSRKLSRAESKVTDGQVSVTVRHDSPLKTTLQTTRTLASRSAQSPLPASATLTAPGALPPRPAPLRLDNRQLDDRELDDRELDDRELDDREVEYAA